MATELSRTFDLAHGAVVVNIQDKFGNVSPHTLYVSSVPNVDAAVAQLLIDTDTQAAALRTAMIAAGWIAPSSAS
jgi:hypothetical protein